MSVKQKRRQEPQYHSEEEQRKTKRNFQRKYCVTDCLFTEKVLSFNRITEGKQQEGVALANTYIKLWPAPTKGVLNQIPGADTATGKEVGDNRYALHSTRTTDRTFQDMGSIQVSN